MKEFFATFIFTKTILGISFWSKWWKITMSVKQIFQLLGFEDEKGWQYILSTQWSKDSVFSRYPEQGSGVFHFPPEWTGTRSVCHSRMDQSFTVLNETLQQTDCSDVKWKQMCKSPGVSPSIFPSCTKFFELVINLFLLASFGSICLLPAPILNDCASDPTVCCSFWMSSACLVPGGCLRSLRMLSQTCTASWLLQPCSWRAADVAF